MVYPVCCLVMFAALLMFANAEQQKSNVYGCTSPQYVAMNSEQGFIYCTLPPKFKAVYWYDDVLTTTSTSPIVGYDSTKGYKTGHGYEDGKYDVMSNGSLVIYMNTTDEDRSFKVICFDENDNITIYTSSLVILVESSLNQPIIETCTGPICYGHYTKAVNIICSFNGTKPGRQLVWLPKIVNKDIENNSSMVMSPNDDGTFNSTATITIKHSTHEWLSYWVCEAYWVYPDQNKKISFVIDFSDDAFFKSRSIDYTISAEVDKNIELRCGHGPHMNMWKKVTNDGIVEFLGLQAFGNVKKNDSYDDMVLTNDGNIEFTSVQVKNEGLYICLRIEDTTTITTSVFLEVIVPPTPQYLVINQCEDEPMCIVSGFDASLACSLFGVRPQMELKWSFEHNLPIVLGNYRKFVTIHDGIFDIQVIVDYKIAREILCDEDIILTCTAYGPGTKLFYPSKEVKIDFGSVCVDSSIVECESHAEEDVQFEKGIVATVTDPLVPVLLLIILMETSLLCFIALRKWCNECRSTDKHGNPRKSCQIPMLKGTEIL